MPNDVEYLEFESYVVQKHIYSKLKCYRIPGMTLLQICMCVCEGYEWSFRKRRSNTRSFLAVIPLFQ